MTNIRGASFDPVRAWTSGGPDSSDGIGPRPGGLQRAESGPNDLSAHAVPKEILSDLLRWEGDVHHMYLDTKGLVTVGIGNLLASASDAQRLPFVDKRTGVPATQEQIAAAFQTVGHATKHLHAGRYASETNLRLPEATVRNLAAHRLQTEFLPGLRRTFPGFDSFPAPAQRALIDMAYNMGVNKLGHFENLRQACQTGDWQTAATECHRRTCRAERNDWTKQLFLQAATISQAAS